jgi:hypothetical protein
VTSADALLAEARRAVGQHEAVEGWGTVELERAAGSVGRGGTSTPAPDDELLGARSLLVRLDGSDAALALLEPSTEGLLAATLARHGEGLAVTYLVAPDDATARLRTAGIRLSREAGSPLGPARLVLGGDRWGPHVVVVRGGHAAAWRGDEDGPAATIER